MLYFLSGLIVFLGAHSLRIVADGWRARSIARIGLLPWKGIYTVASLAGFALMVWGYGESRYASAVLYYPPVYTRHIAGLLMLVSLVLLAATYVPRNHIKAALGHPMYAGIKVWAFAHLLANGRVVDVILFGAFLAWAIAGFVVSRKRDRAAGTVYPPGNEWGTILTLLIGVALWGALVSGLHLWLTGVSPMP